jgi:hypothetical protein
MDQPDHRPDSETDDQPDARWMTFEELARARGISKLSAAALVRRHRWRRQRDNRGRVIALVPNDGPELRRIVEPDHPPDDQPDHPGSTPDHLPDDRPYTAAFDTALTAIEAAHAREIKALHDQLETSEQGRAAAMTQLADATTRAERAEAAVAGERQRADALRDRLETARAETEEARQALDQVRRADEARRARGRLRRAWDGWRGR